MFENQMLFAINFTVRQNYGFMVGRGSFFLVVDIAVIGSNLKDE